MGPKSNVVYMREWRRRRALRDAAKVLLVVGALLYPVSLHRSRADLDEGGSFGEGSSFRTQLGRSFR